MKIVFLIRALTYGGAERQLTVLSKGLCERGHDVVIAMFYAGGPLEKELANTQVRVRSLKKRGRWDVLLVQGLDLGVEHLVVQDGPVKAGQR